MIQYTMKKKDNWQKKKRLLSREYQHLIWLVLSMKEEKDFAAHNIRVKKKIHSTFSIEKQNHFSKTSRRRRRRTYSVLYTNTMTSRRMCFWIRKRGIQMKTWLKTRKDSKIGRHFLPKCFSKKHTKILFIFHPYFWINKFIFEKTFWLNISEDGDLFNVSSWRFTQSQ